MLSIERRTVDTPEFHREPFASELRAERAKEFIAACGAEGTPVAVVIPENCSPLTKGQENQYRASIARQLTKAGLIVTRTFEGQEPILVFRLTAQPLGPLRLVSVDAAAMREAALLNNGVLATYYVRTWGISRCTITTPNDPAPVHKAIRQAVRRFIADCSDTGRSIKSTKTLRDRKAQTFLSRKVGIQCA